MAIGKASLKRAADLTIKGDTVADKRAGEAPVKTVEEKDKKEKDATKLKSAKSKLAKSETTKPETVKRGRTQPKKAEVKNTQPESVISKTLIKTSEKAESSIMPEMLSNGQTSRITCVLPTYLL